MEGLWKKNMYRLIHILRQFFLILKESKKAIFISVIFLLIGLITLGSSYIVGRKLFRTSLTLKDTISITVFFKLDNTEEETKKCLDVIKEIDGVKNVTHVEKEQAKEDFENFFPQYKDVIDALPENPLPATAKVEIDDLSMGKKIVNIITTFPVVDMVIFSEDLAKKIDKLINLIWFLFISILLVVALEFIFTVQSITSLTVDLRKMDIKVMKLIGADNVFIEVPFILLSLFSALVAWSISIFVLQKINNWSSGVVQNLLPFSGQISDVNIAQIYGVLLVFSVTMSLIGSVISLRRVK
jgi:cell division transport system permease protein